VRCVRYTQGAGRNHVLFGNPRNAEVGWAMELFVTRIRSVLNKELFKELRILVVSCLAMCI
jgi:hypothetical protein